MADPGYAGYIAVLLADLPNCPAGLKLKEFRSAVRQLCIDSEAYRAALPAINLVAGDDTYTLTPPTGMEIRRVVGVRQSGAEADLAQCAYDRATGILTLPAAPTAAEAGGLVVTVALAPLPTGTTEVADWFLVAWAEAAGARTLATLYRQPGKAWTNPALANVHTLRYIRAFAGAVREIGGQHRAVAESAMPKRGWL